MAPKPLEPRDHTVTLAEAVEMTRRHRTSDMRAVTIRAGGFHKDQVMALLSQSGCTALRIYLGRDDTNEPVFVLVGVDASGADMTKGTILEKNQPCPPYCDDTSTLAV